MKNGIDWEVLKYGIVIDEYKTWHSGKCVEQKIHLFKGNLYVSTWYNGIRLLFHELFD